MSTATYRRPDHYRRRHKVVEAYNRASGNSLPPRVLVPMYETRSGSFGLGIARMGVCAGCGRTLVNAVRAEGGLFRSTCGRCFDWSALEGQRVDHEEWLRARGR